MIACSCLVFYARSVGRAELRYKQLRWLWEAVKHGSGGLLVFVP